MSRDNQHSPHTVHVLMLMLANPTGLFLYLEQRKPLIPYTFVRIVIIRTSL